MSRESMIADLESWGYIVIPPGDASPVGELVRAAVAYAEAGGTTWDAKSSALLKAARKVAGEAK